MVDIQRREPAVRTDRYRTKDGKEFEILRKPRPSRRYQKPVNTGQKLACPFCTQEHDVLEYTIRRGQAGERKARTWSCPKTGTLSLNVGHKFQEYVDTLVVRREEASKDKTVDGVEVKSRTENEKEHTELQELIREMKEKYDPKFEFERKALDRLDRILLMLEVERPPEVKYDPKKLASARQRVRRYKKQHPESELFKR